MKLAKLFLRPEWNQTNLARAAGVDPSHICHLAAERCQASLGLALLLEGLTGGLVRAEDVPLSKASRDRLAAMRVRQSSSSSGAQGAA